ncbi:MAG: hypothetical protein FWD25_08160 [Clostridia bacterium]|nr:hypothetical protein [Clostridia bacterium]
MYIAKRGWKKPLALMCALILCLAPCLASAAVEASQPVVKPGEMLNARMLQALTAGRRFDATLRYGLESVEMEDVSAEEMEAVRQVLEAVELQMGFGFAGDNVEIDLALALGGQTLIAGKAYVAEEGFALETNLLPGKVVLVSYEKIMGLLEESGASFDIDEEALGVLLQALETYGEIVMAWAEEITENNMEISMQPQPATDTRDASAMQVKAWAGDADFNRLLVAFATKFVSDTDLQQALASLTGESERDIAWIGYEILRQADEMPEQGNMLTVDVQAGMSGELVGVDYLQVVPMDDDALAIAVNYGRKSQEVVATDTVRVDIGTRTGFGYTVDMQINTDESVQNALTQDYTMHVRAENTTPYFSPRVVVMDAEGRVHTEINGNVETIKQEIVYVMKEEGGGPTDPATAAMFGAPMRVTGETVTEALAGDDFRTVTHMRTDMGIMVMTMGWTLASSEFVPTTMEGKTVIDPFTMTEEEGEALGEEMSGYLMQAMFTAMGSLPPAVIQMLMEGGAF